jgi:acyl carrier protein phosphodiesterase
MKKPTHIPSYIFLLGEYVAQLEALQQYRDKPIPAEVWESMQQRAKELKAIRIEHLDADVITKEIIEAQSQIFIK